MSMGKPSHAPYTRFKSWETIPWSTAKKKVERLQMRIAKVALEFVLELLGVPKRLMPLKCLSRMPALPKP
jgi:hypothetical protein